MQRFISIRFSSVSSVPPCWVYVLVTIHPKISLLNGAAGADLGRGTGFEDAAVDHDSERVGDGKHGVHVVFDQQDRMVLRQIAQQGNDAHRLFGARACCCWTSHSPAWAPKRDRK